MKKVYIAGVGMGNGCLTEQAQKAVDEAEVIIGSSRMVKDCKKPVFNAFYADEIKRYIEDSDKNVFCVLVSGDSGFYSGAKRLSEVLDGFETQVIAGISSFSYFFAALKKDYNDTKFLSLHGRERNVVSYIRRYKSVFFLTDELFLEDALQKLCNYGLGDVKIYIGERLSYPEERIVSGTAAELAGKKFDKLSVVLAENENARAEYGSIPDSEFIRGNVPMTKAEVRSLAAAKLNLCEDSVLYDIGAGTGSVSVEAARYLIDGSVYAFEKNEEAIGLIEANCVKFGVDNVVSVHGTAPACFDFEKYPIPTHAFIGGSGGKLAETLEILFEKNHGLRAVVTAVSLNTIAEITELSEKYKADICCINAAKAEKAGTHLLMKAANPVYIAVFTEKKL